MPNLVNPYTHSTTTLPPSDFEVIAINPDAVAQPTALGKVVKALYADSGKIYMGYGDWNDNTGKIYIRSYDPVANTQAREFYQATEAIEKFRLVDGVLYSPDIDPIAGESSGGYAYRDLGGTWRDRRPVTGLHMFDVNSTSPGVLWMPGSAGNNATVWRSTDNGVSWQTVYSQTDGGFDRAYGLEVLNGEAYISPTNSFEMLVYSGGTWSSTGISMTIDYKKSTVFDGKIVGSYGAGLQTYDGSTAQTYNLPMSQSGSYQYAARLYPRGGYLYVLTFTREVVRTNDFTNWDYIGTVESADFSNSSALAVDDTHVYVGGVDGKLLRSTATIN